MEFQQGRLLSELCTFGIGGPARYFVEVTSIPEMCQAIAYCKSQDLPFLVIGKGSNCLFDDQGFDGVVILNKISYRKQEGPLVEVGAGYSFSLLGAQMAREGWAGLEFASGIPATVGGAVYMNAGANGMETADLLKQVTYVNEKGECISYAKSELTFAYRTSSFQQMKGAIVSATFLLTPSKEARQKQLGIIEYRMQTQPYGDKSAGCVFRNPDGSAAGALIEKCGLKGEKVGDAQVSSLHANFIVNTGSATAQDVLTLATHVQETVKNQTGIHLEMEVRHIPHIIT
jgi:UDP-N-acetylmuramate dehydrogenase